MTGFPLDHQGPLPTIGIDFGREVEFVREGAAPVVTGDGRTLYPVVKSVPPIRVKGPISEAAYETGVLDDEPERIPDFFEITGSVVRFHFTEPLQTGTHRVLVYASRFRLSGLSDGEGVVDDNGDPYQGWSVVIQHGVPVREAPAPAAIEPSAYPAPPKTTATPGSVRVFLDGKPLPPGSSELSGEALVVETSETTMSSLELRVEGAARTDYETYLVRTPITGPGGGSAMMFTSGFPIGSSAWAQFFGVRTEGTIPLDGRGRLASGIGVVRPPTLARDGFRIEETTVEAGQTTYDLITYHARPASGGLPEWSTSFVYGEPVAPTDPTPHTQPDLFDHAFYGASRGDDYFAVLDLPVCCRLSLVHTDEFGMEKELWWGQTRLLPLLVQAREVATALGRPPTTPAELAELRASIHTASIEALSLWGCALPTYPVAVMVEYVKTRVASGWNRTGGLLGKFSARIGDHAVSGERDDLGVRRLRGLTAMLQNCDYGPGIRPEDVEPYDAGIAHIASLARPEYHPHRPMLTIPTYSPVDPRVRRVPGAIDRPAPYGTR